MPTDSFATGSVEGAAVLTAVLLFAGALLGFAFQRLLYRRDGRRPEYRAAPTASLQTSLALAALVFAGFAGVAYFTCWRCFYTLTVDGDALVLHYWLPQREVWIERQAMERVDAAMAGKLSQELRIETRNGIHTSGQLGRVQSEAILRRIQEWRQAADPPGK